MAASLSRSSFGGSNNGGHKSGDAFLKFLLRSVASGVVIAGSSLSFSYWYSSSVDKCSFVSFADSADDAAWVSSDDLLPQKKKKRFLFGDSYRRRVFFNYEKRIRLQSPPEKLSSFLICLFTIIPSKHFYQLAILRLSMSWTLDLNPCVSDGGSYLGLSNASPARPSRRHVKPRQFLARGNVKKRFKPSIFPSGGYARDIKEAAHVPLKSKQEMIPKSPIEKWTTSKPFVGHFMLYPIVRSRKLETFK
ncbi:hypothetical protein OIU84_000825 [Salix udensis]|uniref:Uncharacterized protein n=1 Tax=Salix udensis TaxID=889485 RepID=A0AAD6L5M3_9ROSI|nr:hypothetical protein OIU84_000825 [Salix udensis]